MGWAITVPLFIVLTLVVLTAAGVVAVALVKVRSAARTITTMTGIAQACHDSLRASEKDAIEPADAMDLSACYAVKPMSNTEQRFFTLLKSSLPHYVVLAQVDLRRIVRSRRCTPRTSPNRSPQLLLDYVVCQPDFSVVAVIELDDMSHDDEVQRALDAKKDDVMNAVNIPLLRYDVSKQLPSPYDIALQIEQLSLTTHFRMH